MYRKQFQDKEISALGYGGLRFPMDKNNPSRIDREASQKLIDAAIASGINFFDTAYTYQAGDSERFLGEALSKYPRDSYYLSTKFYADAGVTIEEAFETQLERCGVDYFDFYLFHSLDENFINYFMDPEKDCLGYLIKQKKAGRIKHIGFSSHAGPDTLEKFVNWYDGFDMAIIQLNYLDWDLLNAKRQYEILTEHNIPIWVMEPLKGGRLSELNEEARAILKEAAPERSVSSWGMRYLMGLPNVQVVMSGMSSLEQLEDNLKTFDHFDPLSEKELEVLKKAAAAFRKDLGVPCSSCTDCCPTCPMELNIPVLIKGYNEWNMSKALWKVAELITEKTPDNCIGCGVCLHHCPQKIQIPEVMSKFADIIKENDIDFTKI